MKVTIELESKDWGKIAIALQRYLNCTRNDLNRCSGTGHSMLLITEVATLARIKASLANQRKAQR